MATEKQVVAGVTERIDTGVVQFGKDWPGVYLKGQDALQAAALLGRLEGKVSNPGVQLAIDELAALLRSCFVKERG